MTASFMQRYGRKMIDGNWPILPIMPGSKAPGEVKGGEWRPYGGWSKHCERETKAFEIAVWSTWADAGVGVACGKAVGIDIDVTDAEIARRIEALCHEKLGYTTFRRVGQAPKVMLVYRARTPFKAFQRGPIQILAAGRQFVSYAVHPGTGKPYEWTEEAPADAPLADAPEVDEAKVRAFLEEAVTLLPEGKRKARLPDATPHGAAVGTSVLGQRGTVAAVRSALEVLPNDDWHYDDWIKVGLAIKGALGDEGRELFIDWSAKADKDEAVYTANAWDKMRPPHSIGAGSLYTWAAKYGWIPPHDVILNPEIEAAVEAAPVPIVVLEAAGVADAEARPKPALPQQKIDNALYPKSGLLADMVAHIAATAYVPQPWLALGAAIAAVGTLAGRRYAAPNGLRGNVQIIGIAGSGGGKDHARKWLVNAFTQANLTDYLGGMSIASGPALTASLEQHSSKLCMIDEFGHFLGAVLSKRAPAHKAEIWARLTEMFTTSASTFLGTEYANQKDRPRCVIHQPNLCVYGTTVPDPFWAALEGGHATDGSLARWLVFQTDEHYPAYNPDCAGPGEIPDGILERLRAITFGAVDHDYGGDLAMLMSPSVSPTPYPVPFATAEAQQLYRDTQEQQHQWLRGAGGGEHGGSAAILARHTEHVMKLALIAAVARDPEFPKITDEDMTWARDVTQHCLGLVMQEAAARVADNESEANIKKVYRLIEAIGVGGIPQNVLTRKTQWLKNGKHRSEILDDLVEAGLVVRFSVDSTGGRKAWLYVATAHLNDADQEGTIH